MVQVTQLTKFCFPSGSFIFLDTVLCSVMILFPFKLLCPLSFLALNSYTWYLLSFDFLSFSLAVYFHFHTSSGLDLTTPKSNFSAQFSFNCAFLTIRRLSPKQTLDENLSLLMRVQHRCSTLETNHALEKDTWGLCCIWD